MASSTSSTTTFPPSVHISQHPCVQAKLSQLRSASTNARETKALVHEIATMVGCEALAKALTVQAGETVSGSIPFSWTRCELEEFLFVPLSCVLLN
jgi:uracil phosphoribosyltransferase